MAAGSVIGSERKTWGNIVSQADVHGVPAWKVKKRVNKLSGQSSARAAANQMQAPKDSFNRRWKVVNGKPTLVMGSSRSRK